MTSKNTPPESPLPPQTFIRATPAADGSNQAAYIPYAASEYILRETAAICGLSLAHMGRLLGLSDPSVVYRWTGCEHRPSPVYQARIAGLLILHSKGIKCYFLTGINWTTGDLFWSDSYLQAQRDRKKQEMKEAAVVG
jgi:hypothetical protein